MKRSLLIVVVACSPTYLPPPAAPPQVTPIPSVTLGPPVQGETTVLIDSDRPAQVGEITGMATSIAYGRYGAYTAAATITRPVCLTPCAAHLTQGAHALVFTRTDTGEWGGEAQLEVGINPTAYRYALGRRNAHFGARFGGLLALSFGLTAVITGGTLWAVSSSSNDLTSAGQTTTAIGAALTVLGAVLLYTNRPEIQNGTGTRWELPPGPPSGPPTMTPPSTTNAFSR
jgi:hypothetical protein